VDENEEEEEEEEVVEEKWDFVRERKGEEGKKLTVVLYIVIIPVLFRTTYHTTLVSS